MTGGLEHGRASASAATATEIATAIERLGRTELAPLVDELARRYGEGDAPASVSLRNIADLTRGRLADLLGTDRMPDPAGRLGVQRLAGALGLSSGEELREVVEALRGPLGDRRSAREAEQMARASLWNWLQREVSALGFGGEEGALEEWVESQRAAGARGGAAQHRLRLESTLAVLRRLPAEGASLAALASDCTGDPHALDYGRALPALVLDAASVALGRERPGDAESARTLWEAFGVVPDPHSSSVLVLGLRPADGGALSSWLEAAANAGQPVVLSLANLRRWPLPPLACTSPVFVFENPSVLAHAIAASGSWQGPPLVCSSGRPTVATVTLLRQLGRGGATLFQHADLDPSGVSITAWLTERAGTVPWRMGEQDYLAALAGLGSAAGALTGRVPPSPWNPGLSQAMEDRRLVVYEEQLRDELLDAMRSSSTPQR